MKSMQQVRRKIADYSKLMYQQGYVAASEGNISCRTSDNHVLITPSRFNKNFITEKDIVQIDMNGDLLEGLHKPTTERFTHLEIYRQNPDVRAIVHAHPFYTVLATVLGYNPFEKCLLSEAGMFLKNVKIAPYAKPSTKDGAAVIEALCRETRILVIERHGSFTYGSDLSDAFSSLEIMEKSAKMDYYARISGRPFNYLSDEEVRELGKIPY